MRGFVIGFSLATVLLVALGVRLRAGESQAMFKVLLIDQDTVVAQPYVPPQVGLKIDPPDPSAKLPVKGEILRCVQKLAARKFTDHTETVVQLRCGDRKYILSDIYFTN